MDNGQLDISTIILAAAFAIIGAILLWVGNRKHKRLLWFWGIGFFIGAGVSLFVKSAELREILTALAAVFAIFIAAFSFDESRRLRQETADREKRDRKERLLNEIIEWAIDIKKCLYSTEAIGKPQKNLYAVTHLMIGSALAKRKKIETIAQKVFGDDLFKHVKNVEGTVAQFAAGIRLAIEVDEGPLLIPEIREKIKQARKQGWKEVDAILNENFQKPTVSSTTKLIEKCSQLIAEL